MAYQDTSQTQNSASLPKTYEQINSLVISCKIKHFTQPQNKLNLNACLTQNY